MNVTPIWMPLYVGDYMGDTIGLTNAEHGAYLLSMMAYWRKGESLTSSELREVCKKEVDRIQRFYIFVDGRYHHKRIDAELGKCRENIRKYKERAAKMVQARRDVGQLPPKV
jgi:uncharacterized protein YdaU (DUF1376 family)